MSGGPWPPWEDGTQPNGYLVQTALASPMDWEGGGRVHNWRRYIDEPVRSLWDTFSDQQKVALAMNADAIADREVWD